MYHEVVKDTLIIVLLLLLLRSEVINTHLSLIEKYQHVALQQIIHLPFRFTHTKYSPFHLIIPFFSYVCVETVTSASVTADIAPASVPSGEGSVSCRVIEEELHTGGQSFTSVT